MASATLALTVHTFLEGLRARWVIVYTLVFFMLAINVPMIVLISARYLPPDYLEAYLTGLMALSFPFLPLLSLPLAATSIVDEKESGLLEYMLSNPVSRLSYLMSKLAGLFLSTTLVVVGGYLIAAFLSYGIRINQMGAILPLLGSAMLLNTIMLLLGLLISIVSKRKITAMMIGIFFWFMFTVLSDIGSLSILVSIAGAAPIVLFLTALNPIEAARLLGIYGTRNVGFTELGSIGLILRQLIGEGAPLFILSVQLMWVGLLLILCINIFIRSEIL
ncbi:ABC-2 type transport system permease [Candidatus Caldarchaeum subterraneum]|uniref:ABC-2 type transport system permease n=1 Tax=Caldiarchaeum subterraneum TaxID=311458 RepID=E6N4M8_CALS0|nr:ABC-2 type transport system permease [Candidatus Caldarchaeum subterraneum]BAJ50087.1 ABC-2 type transport system permease [Candidatus Caldarchaeum subterraneum]